MARMGPPDKAQVEATRAALDSDKRDVVDLWNEALGAYRDIIGTIDLEPPFQSMFKTGIEPRFKDTNAIIAFNENEMQKFHKWRHDGGKVNKLRSLFSNNIQLIMDGTQQLAAAASTAFPPAASIGVALTIVLSASKSVSADYDVIYAFFEDMKGFLERVTILNGNLPGLRVYSNCLVAVFSSILKLCGFATKYMKKGRFRKWLRNSVLGEDSDLAGAQSELNGTLKDLQNASEFAILGNTEKIKDMQGALVRNLDEQESRRSILLAKLEGDQQNILKGVQQLLHFMEQEKSQKNDVPVESRPTINAISRIRSVFDDVPENEMQLQMIEQNHVPQTCGWLFEDATWQKWISSEDGDDAFLFLTGPPGLGKSHLAVAAYHNLHQNANKIRDRTVCTALVFNRESVAAMQRVQTIVASILLQLSDQNLAIREQLNSMLSIDGDRVSKDSWYTIFTRLMANVFAEDSQHQLNVVIDAANELTPVDRLWLGSILQSVRQKKLKIKVLITMRPGVELKTLQGNPVIGNEIKVTREHALADLRLVADNRMQSIDSAFDGLVRLEPELKATVRTFLEENAESIAYAEYVLRYLSAIGRPGAIVKELATLPTDMIGLLTLMLETTQRRTPIDVQPVLRTIMAWVAFSFDPVTLDEANFLVRVKAGKTSLSVQEDIQEFTLKFLRIGTTLPSHRRNALPLNIDSTLSDASVPGPGLLNDGDLEVVFRELSMREFFRQGAKNEPSLRTYALDAHKDIFKFCCQILETHQEIKDTKQSIAYALRYSLRHWMCLDAELDRLSSDDLMEISNGFARLISDRHGMARALEESAAPRINIDDLFAFNDLAKSEPFYNKFIITWQLWQGVVRKKLAPSSLTASAWQYWNSTTGHPLIPLIRAHVDNWLTAVDPGSARIAYTYALRALCKTPMKNLVTCTSAEIELLEIKGQLRAAYMSSEDRSTEVFQIRKAFHNSPDSNSHFATAVILKSVNAVALAIEEMHRAIEMCQDDTALARYSIYLARIHLETSGPQDRERISTAMSLLQSALETEHKLDPPTRIQALLQQAEAQRLLGQYRRALQIFQHIRSTNDGSFIPIAALTAHFKIGLYFRDYMTVLIAFASWTSIERLAWVTTQSEFSNAQIHSYLQKRAMGKDIDRLISIYEDLIESLDAEESGAPWRLHLASVFWRMQRNSEGAEEVLDRIIDSSCNGQVYALGGNDAGFIATEALNMMSDVLYQRFRASRDVEVKMQILQKAKALPQRDLLQSVQIGTTALVPHLLVLSRMTRKIGSPVESVNILKKAFDICWESLHDRLIWNDPSAVRNMAKVLMELPELKREAEILLASQLYYLDQPKSPDDISNINADGFHIDGEEGFHLPTDVDNKAVKEALELIIRGDTMRPQPRITFKTASVRYADESNVESVAASVGDSHFGPDPRWHEQRNYSYYQWISEQEEWEQSSKDLMFPKCQGENCDKVWETWYGSNQRIQNMYMCLHCTGSVLCRACHKKRLRMNRGDAERMEFCCRNGEYLEGPLEGWKGIKDGKILLEGAGQVEGGEKSMNIQDVDELIEMSFKDFLESTKKKWEMACTRFWEG